MKIIMPKNFDLESSLNFCNYIDSVCGGTEYIYDYKNMNRVEPLGMLLIGSKIRQFVNEQSSCKHADTNYKNSTYAAHMGFFQSIYQDFGKKPGEASGSNTYIPITDLDIKESYKIAFNCGQDIYSFMQDKATDLAAVLSRGNKNIQAALTFSILEVIRNVYDHSDSQKLWYAGQYWPSNDLVEIAILDEGKGINESLRRNRKIQIDNDRDALKLALEPGISRNIISNKKVNSSAWSNAGYGLYMTSNICRMGGDFLICSGNTCLFINSQELKYYDTNFKGTAIRMRIRPSSIPIISKVLRELSLEGKRREKEIQSLSEISVATIY